MTDIKENTSWQEEVICEQEYRITYIGWMLPYVVEFKRKFLFFTYWESCHKNWLRDYWTAYSSLDDAESLLEELKQYKNYKEFCKSKKEILPSYKPPKP